MLRLLEGSGMRRREFIASTTFVAAMAAFNSFPTVRPLAPSWCAQDGTLAPSFAVLLFGKTILFQ